MKTARKMLFGLFILPVIALGPGNARGEEAADARARAGELIEAAREHVAEAGRALPPELSEDPPAEALRRRDELLARAAEAYAAALEIHPGWKIDEVTGEPSGSRNWRMVRAREARADLWQSMRRFEEARAEMRAALAYPSRDQSELQSWIHEVIGDISVAEENWTLAEKYFADATRIGLFGGARDRVPPKLENAREKVSMERAGTVVGAVRDAMSEAGRVLVSTVALPWGERGRRLETVLARLDEAGALGSDIVLLPMECVATGAEPIPGPTSSAIAAKAKEYGMYVIGNLREKDGDRTYVTSFLCGRDGRIIGRYRKSHALPGEDMDLGDELPVFETDFGLIAMRIGSDRFFPDIDHVYTAKGARMIFWSQGWEALEDEHMQDFPSAGRAFDYNVFIACARYAPAWSNPLPSFYQQRRRGGDPVGKAYVVNRRGMRIASTTHTGGIATAVIRRGELSRPGRPANPHPAWSVLTEPVRLTEEKEWAKREVRVTAIDNHLGIGALLQRLDEAGRMGSDIVATYEFVWIRGDRPDVPGQTTRARENLRRIREKAREHSMYVLVCGVIDRIERNEAILYDRRGEEAGRYYKMSGTHPEMIPGEETTVMETDFGRIGVRICADNPRVEIDRAYGVKGVDIMFDLTQEWGTGGVSRRLRSVSRAMDQQFFLVEATHVSTDAMHASMIVEPTGAVVARSSYGAPGLVSAVIHLDRDRPRRYRREGFTDEGRSMPVVEEGNDLRRVVLSRRRPELYRVLAGEDDGSF